MFVVVVVSVLLGVLLTLLVQWLVVQRWFYGLPILTPPWKDQYNKFYLPKDIQDALRDPDLRRKKETCLSLNLFFQFLFQELRDTRRLRRWVMRRMNMEFTEMLQTTTGKLLDQITVRDFNVGDTFPIIKNISVQNTVLKEDSMLEEVSLLLDLTYRGGFQLAVDVEMVFGKSAYLSVKVTKLQGRARLQLTRIPYTHWSFSFLEDPVLEFEVESHFEGRPVPQITSLIVNQIRRTIRKKHTLPNYKIRYKPFFHKPEPTPQPQEIYYQGSKLSRGTLAVTVLGCNRLVKVVGGAYMYCTLALDTVPWVELMSSRRKLWVAHDIEILKTQGQNIGLSFKDDYIMDRYEDMVIVDVVTPYSPAALANIKKNDVLVSVGGVKVTNTKQAAKLMKQATDKLILRVERSSSLKGLHESNSSPELKFEEDTISLKDGEVPDDPEPNKDDSEDYINITLSPMERQAASGAAQAPSENSKPVLKEVNGAPETIAEDGSNSSPSKKAFAILSSGTGLFNRKKMRLNEKERDTKSPTKAGSTEPKPKAESQGPSQQSQNKGSEDEQKIKVGPATKNVTQEAKKNKDNGVQSTKEKAKESNPRYETVSVTENLDQKPAGVHLEHLPADQEPVNLKKTQFLKAAEDLLISEKFDFEVEETHNFLNVCVWCKIPEKLDKQSRVIKPEKDILLGHVSIPLMDIALECLATLQGDFQTTYKLTPAEMKPGASRTKISNLAAHPGFDEKLCYGDITLEFTHTHLAGPFSKLDRQNIDRIRQEAENRESQLNADNKNGDIPLKVQQTVKRAPPEPGKHDFIGTHFQSVTYCNFCHKKIWLKTAFQCQVCGMVCHKKCTERCQMQTICTKDGFEIKEPPSSAFRRSMKESTKEEAKDGKDTVTPGGGMRASFLSRLRNKDGARGAEAGKAPDSPGKPPRRPSTPEARLDTDLSPYPERKRRNSAPEENELPAGTGSSPEEADKGRAAGAGKAGGLLGVANVPRTRSTQSIRELVRSKLSPGGHRKKESSSSSSDLSEGEEEVNVLEFYERQKAAHNADELVVTAAKEMGRELYAHLSQEQRKDKLDGMISKLQQEIDTETDTRSEYTRQEREAADTKSRSALRAKMERSDEKVQSLAMLMLHYCAGLQHCLEETELDRRKQAEAVDSDRLAAMEMTHSAPGGLVVQEGKVEEEEDDDLQDIADQEDLSERFMSLENDVDDSDVDDDLIGEMATPPEPSRFPPVNSSTPFDRPSEDSSGEQQLKPAKMSNLAKDDSDSASEPEEYVESGKESDAMSEDFTAKLYNKPRTEDFSSSAEDSKDPPRAASQELTNDTKKNESSED